MKKRILVVVTAAAAPVLIWAVAKAFDTNMTVDMRNGQPATAIGLAIVAAFAAQAALLGWAALALLERFLPRHARVVWTVLAVAVLLVSFAPVVAVAAATGTKMMLALMHLAVAAVLIPALPRAKKVNPA